MLHCMPRLSPSLAGLLLVCASIVSVASAQPDAAQTVTRYEILSLDVEGAVGAASSQFVVQTSGLQVGQQVVLPYDEAFGEAVRKLYRGGLFSEVEIVADRIVGEGVFLLVRVVEEPRLGGYTLEGVSGGERNDLEDELPLVG